MSLINTRTLVYLIRPRVLLNSARKTQQCMVQAKDIRAHSISSSFVPRGLVSQNVQKLKKDESAESEKKDYIVKNMQDEEEFPKITRKETKMVITDPEISSSPSTTKQNPIVLMFGWGGASHKNLSKYSSIYLEAGFTTVQYILPTRHIFRDTAQTPEVMGNLLMQLEKVDIHERPVYIHCLSDTGVMCYQGMDVVRKQSSKMKRLNICGVVWDSCCGPRPEITISRVMALFLVNWMCCLRDRMGMMQSLNSSYRLLVDRGWPGLKGKWQGKPVELSLIDGTWSGYFGRDHYNNFPSIPELFIYSNRDFYLPSSYLEREVIEPRKKVGADFTAVRFKGSPHVAHLRYFKEEYRREVLSFINVNKNVKSVKEKLQEREHDEDHKKDRKGYLDDAFQPKFL